MTTQFLIAYSHVVILTSMGKKKKRSSISINHLDFGMDQFVSMIYWIITNSF